MDAIKRDTAFLATHHMMDYSLLAGICRNSGELVVGIIDYIRTFTWDKKLETWVSFYECKVIILISELWSQCFCVIPVGCFVCWFSQAIKTSWHTPKVDLTQYVTFFFLLKGILTSFLTFRLVKSVKSSGVFGGPAKTPTVINPEFYRFFLNTIFYWLFFNVFL